MIGIDVLFVGCGKHSKSTPERVHRSPQAGRWAMWALCWLVHALFLSLIGETNGGATGLCKQAGGSPLGGGPHSTVTAQIVAVRVRTRADDKWLLATDNRAAAISAARRACTCTYLPPRTWPPFPIAQKATTPFSTWT